MYVCASVPNMGGTLCGTTQYDLVPINCKIIVHVDVQDTFYFDHDLISDPGQSHKNT